MRERTYVASRSACVCLDANVWNGMNGVFNRACTCLFRVRTRLRHKQHAMQYKRASADKRAAVGVELGDDGFRMMYYAVRLCERNGSEVM